MEPMSMLLWAFFWGVIGFITTLIFGIDIPKFISDIIAVLILMLPIIFFNQYMDIDATVTFLQNYITTFVNMLPSIAFGEIAGTFFGAILRSIRQSNQTPQI